jgi:hypothetical protein
VKKIVYSVKFIVEIDEKNPDAISNIEIPENETSKYKEDSFEVVEEIQEEETIVP